MAGRNPTSISARTLSAATQVPTAELLKIYEKLSDLDSKRTGGVDIHSATKELREQMKQHLLLLRDVFNNVKTTMAGELDDLQNYGTTLIL